MKKPKRQKFVLIISVLTIFTIGILITTDVASREEKVYPETTGLYVVGGNVPEVPLAVKSSPKATVVRPVGYYAWDDLLRKYDWNINTARRIMWCESGGNPTAVNDNPRTGDYSIGLFQINLYGNLKYSRPSEEWLKIAENNAEYAYKMYKSSGWDPWSCINKI